MAEVEQVDNLDRSLAGRFRTGIRSIDGNLLRLWLAVIVILVLLGLARPDTFLTWRNMQSMAVQFPEFGILAFAIMITMLTGGIDLSIVGTANLAAIFAALTMTRLSGDGGAGMSPAVVLLSPTPKTRKNPGSAWSGMLWPRASIRRMPS